MRIYRLFIISIMRLMEFGVRYRNVDIPLNILLKSLKNLNHSSIALKPSP